MADATLSRSRPRRRWGRRLLITLIVLLIIAGIALIVLDRFAASFAEREIANRVAQQVSSQQAHSATPEVSIRGVPFLTQVVSGRYREIDILLRDFSAPAGNDRTVRMPALDIQARDVRAPLETLRTRQGSIIATTVTGTGTVDYPSVAALIGRKGVTLAAKDGKLAVTAPLSALGRSVTVTGTADLAVAGDVLRIRFADLTAAGLPANPLVQGLLRAYAEQISIDVKVPPLPLRLHVRGVQPRPEGLLVTTGADEVPLNTGRL